MAIKGKRKSQSRGSQARRRPASAPRPSVAARHRVPWYRTQQGQALAVGLTALLVGLVWWAVARAQDEAAALERAQDALETFSGEVRAVTQTVRPAALGMSQAPTEAGGDALETLPDEARSWIGTLRAAGDEIGGVRPAPAAAGAYGMFSHSITLYMSAARTFALAADAPEAVAAGVLERAADQRDAAGSAWVLATQELDRARARVELEGAGIAFPGAPGAPATLPTSPPPEGNGGNGTGGGGDGNG